MELSVVELRHCAIISQDILDFTTTDEIQHKNCHTEYDDEQSKQATMNMNKF